MGLFFLVLFIQRGLTDMKIPEVTNLYLFPFKKHSYQIYLWIDAILSIKPTYNIMKNQKYDG